jgi:general secretion pathway protein E
VSSIDRLLDLGLQPFMIASTLLGCMAQRLVKQICPACKTSYQLDSSELVRMGFPVTDSGSVTLYRGEGCRECRSTGYKGRCGVFEIFPLTPQIKKMITGDEHGQEMRKLAIREGMTTIREDAWKKVKAGITSLEEAVRVTAE